MHETLCSSYIGRSVSSIEEARLQKDLVRVQQLQIPGTPARPGLKFITGQLLARPKMKLPADAWLRGSEEKGVNIGYEAGDQRCLMQRRDWCQAHHMLLRCGARIGLGASELFVSLFLSSYKKWILNHMANFGDKRISRFANGSIRKATMDGSELNDAQRRAMAECYYSTQKQAEGNVASTVLILAGAHPID